MTRTAAILSLLTLLSGCAAQAVPGGGNHLTWQAMPDGTAKVSFFGNKDTSVRNLKADMKTGVISIDSMDANGSSLGLQQMQWSIVESNNRRAVIGDMIGMVQSLAPFLIGGGAGIPGIGGAAMFPTVPTTPATPPTSATPAVLSVDSEAVLRAALVAKIAACPTMDPALKAQYTADVQAAPAAYLRRYLAPVVEGAILKVTP